MGGVYIWEAAAGAATAAAAAYYAPPTPPQPQLLLLQRRRQSPKQQPGVTQARPPRDKLRPSGQLASSGHFKTLHFCVAACARGWRPFSDEHTGCDRLLLA